MRARLSGLDGMGLDPRAPRRSRTRRVAEIVITALAIFVLLRTFWIQAFRISSPSMEATLLVGDHLFVSKLDYGAVLPVCHVRLPGLRGVRPGDVVVFQPPPAAEVGPAEGEYVKRCVAVAGERVEMRNRRLFVNGEPRVEPYVLHGDAGTDPRRDNFDALTVPPGHIFVLGDNRDYSHDSRFWGPLPLNLVHGRALIRYFSWDPQGKRIRFDRLLTRVR
jgi:signal peptidase I